MKTWPDLIEEADGDWNRLVGSIICQSGVGCPACGHFIRADDETLQTRGTDRLDIYDVRLWCQACHGSWRADA